jgi:hypothetical protein
MKIEITPITEREWLKFIAIPFEVFLFGYGVFYPFWLFSAPGYPGTMGGPDTSVLDILTIGCLIAFLSLLGISTVQALTRNRRDAVWSFVFSVLAACLAAIGIFRPFYR